MILENIPKMFGMIYAIIVLFILAYLFHKDKFNKKIGYLFFTISSLILSNSTVQQLLNIVAVTPHIQYFRELQPIALF